MFKTKDPENYSLLSGTYPSRPNEGVLPPVKTKQVDMFGLLRLIVIITMTGPALSRSSTT